MTQEVFRLNEKDDKLANLSPPDWAWAGSDHGGRGFANELRNIEANPMMFLSDGKPLKDYHYCFSFRLFSDRMKQDIESQLGLTDNYLFYPSTVMHEGAPVPYWCLVFTSASDVLDPVATIYATPDHVVKPVVSIQKAARLDLFTHDLISPAVFISDRVRALFKKHGAQGVEISKTASTP